MQPSLFESGNIPKHKNNDIIIAKKGNKVLSKKQHDFNKLVKKLETVRRRLATNQTQLDDSLNYYVAELFPLKEQITALKTARLKLLFNHYISLKVLSKNEKKLLGEYIGEELEAILEYSAKEPDDEVKVIFKTIFGQSFDDIKEQSFLEMKEEMENMFDGMGMDINLDDLNMNTSEDDIAKKMKEVQEEILRKKEEEEAKNAKRKKTKKQLEQEAKQKLLDEARNKNISTIYKQLVKVFHPDLETDEMLKIEKEELMKQLTVAYEKNDLHTLLKLEMQWIQNAENNTEKLTDEKLDIYNQLLKEQIAGIENDIYELISHPRYMPLHSFTDALEQLNIKQLHFAKNDIQAEIATCENDQAHLKSSNPIKFVKEIIHVYKNSYQSMEFDIGEFIFFAQQQQKQQRKKTKKNK